MLIKPIAKFLLLFAACAVLQISQAQTISKTDHLLITTKEKNDAMGALLGSSFLSDKTSHVLDDMLKSMNNPRWEYWIRGQIALPTEGEKPTKVKIETAKANFERATKAGWYPAYQELTQIYFCNAPRTPESIRTAIEISKKGHDYHGTKNLIAYKLLFVPTGDKQANIQTAVTLVQEALNEMATWGDIAKLLIEPSILHTAAVAFYLKGDREKSTAYVLAAQSKLDKTGWPLPSETIRDIKKDFDTILSNKPLKLELSSLYLDCDLLAVPE